MPTGVFLGGSFNMKNQQPVLIGLTVFLLLSLIACSTPTPTPPAASTNILPKPSPTAVTPSAPQCVTEKVDLNELANAAVFREYRWSTDGQSIYFQSDDGWWTYSISSRKITPSSEPIINPTPIPTLSAVEQTHRSILEEDYSTLHYDSSLSPSGTRLIYWVNTKRLNAPTATPSNIDLPDEDFRVIAYEEEDIYLIQNGSSDPIHLGKVNGAITHATWLPNEERVVLEMLTFSPDFLLLVDIPARSINPLLSRTDLPGVLKLGFRGVSPDGNWAMYRGYGLSILNINTSKTQELREVQEVYGAWWTPDSKQILLVADAGPRHYSFYIYDLALEKLTRLASDLESKGSFKLLSISDIQAALANVDTNYNSRTHQIYVLYLCLDE